MIPANRSWFPASPGQSAAVVVLTVLLMLNLTVLALMMSGDLGAAGQASGGRSLPGEPQIDRRFESAERQAPTQQEGVATTSPSLAAVIEPAPTRPVDIVNVSAEPFHQPAPVITPTAPAITTTPATQVAAQPVAPTPTPTPSEPEQDEPPVTFFGIDIK